MEQEKSISDIILKRLEYAAKQVGAISACVSIALFGISNIFFEAGTSLGIAIGSFGLLGALEAFHIQTNSKLKERCHLPDANSLLGSFTGKYPKWNPKVIQEFNHHGFGFRTIGFDQLEIPIGISNPLCPACHKPICSESVECKFPGRVAIRLQCSCGFSVASDKTIAEIKEEASAMGGVPR